MFRPRFSNAQIKTTRAEAFNVRQATMKASPQHMYQILLYLKLTGIKHGVLLYENRNDLSMVAIPVNLTPRNEEIIDEALDWMRDVWAMYQEGVMPKCSFKQNSKVCKSCPFSKECWDGEPGTMVFPKMEVHKW